MATEMYMPKQGMDMTEGTIVRWLKNEGDKVERDEPIMEIETDKITMECESPATGILLKKYYDDGAVVPVLTVVGYIGEAGESVPDTAPALDGVEAPKEEAKAPESAKEPEPAPAPEKEAAKLEKDSGIPATPMAKKMAADAGIALADITATGKHGEIVAKDVENAMNAKPNASPLAAAIAADKGIDLSTVTGSGYAGKIMSGDLPIGTAEDNVAGAISEIEAVLERRKLSSMRKVIAERMCASHLEVPNVTQNYKVDVTDLLALRVQMNQGKEKADKISLNDIIIKAVGKALVKFERFRMTLEGNEYVLHNQINIGVAVGLDDGLIVPVIRDVDKKTLSEIAKESKVLASKAREGKIAPEDMGDARISISNIGMFGCHSFTPIVNMPEASIVGVCGTEDELALIDGEIQVRKKMMICVTYDHRILNGTEVCLFEQYLKELLENPVNILI